jgi:hypothetical protein
MEEKLDRIQDKITKAMLNKNPKPKQYTPKNGNGYTTGKITDSILTRSKLLDTHTYSSIPNDDERLDHGSELLAKMQERNSIQDRIRSLTEGSIMNDTDRLYMGKDDNIDAADRVAVGRQSFFRNVNQFNVVSQKGRPISRMEESMLYK